jgi:hypothetical protein
MVLGQHRCAVGTFANRPHAEQVYNELRRAGVPTPQISLVPIDSQDSDQQEVLSEARINNLVEDDSQEEMGAIAAALVGSLLGAIGGCLAGLGLMLAPEIGVVMIMGTWGTTLVTTVAGAGIGGFGCGLLKAVSDMESPEDQAIADFESDSSSKYLVMVEGTEEEVHQVESILDRLNQKYLKINLPSLSENPLLELLKAPRFWKS